MNPRRLYRSRRDRMLAGVAGGLADYLEIDPTVVRILWIISIFFGGFTILLYIILAFIMPLEPVTAPAPGPWQPGPGPGPWAGAQDGAGAGAAGSTEAAGGAETGGGQETGDGMEPSGGSETAAGTKPAAVPDPAAPWLASGVQSTAGYQQPAAARQPGRTSLLVGVLLVVFGAIAALSIVIPGLASGGLLVAALVIGLGVALLVGATTRTANGA